MSPFCRPQCPQDVRGTPCGQALCDFTAGKCCKVQCKHCGWSGRPHATRQLSTAEQERCTRLLARAAVMNGWSHNSVCSPQSQEIFTALRKDFVPPTPFKLRRMVTKLFEETKTAVENRCAFTSPTTCAFSSPFLKSNTMGRSL